MRCQVEWMLFAMGLAQVTGQPSGGIYGPIPCQFSNELRAKKQAKAIELLLEELPQLNLDVRPKKIHKRIDVPPSIPNATSSTPPPSPIPAEPPMPPATPLTTPPPPTTPTTTTTTTTPKPESRVVKHPEGPKSVCARSMAVGVVGYSILCEKRKMMTTTTTTTTTPEPTTTTQRPASRSLFDPLDPRWQANQMSSQEYEKLSKQLESLMRCGNFRCRAIEGDSLDALAD